MKKLTKYTVLAATVLLLASSCEDYLNVKPRGYDIASRMDHYAGLMYGTEVYCLNESFPYMCFEIYTTEEGFANVYSNNGGTHATQGYKWAEDIYREDETCGEWNTFTTLLYNYNKVIAEVMDAEDGTEQQRRAIQAEARVLRAWSTFMMSQFFGSVPIITTSSTMMTDFPLHSEEEVRSFVLSELEEAVPQLSDEPEHYLRVFKVTGLGLYGKILFMYREYDKAASQFAKAFEAMESNPSVKLQNYSDRILENGDIAIIHNNSENSEILYMCGSMPRLMDAVFGGLYQMLFFGVKNEAIDKYFPDKHDMRLASFADISTAVSAYKKYKKTGVYTANINSSLSSNVGLDLSELYTMYAECLARGGNVEKAAELLLELRRNRMDSGHEAIPADVVTADQMTVFAFEERMREQLGFGTSWFDMRRLWNDPLFQDMKAMYVHPVGSDTYTLSPERLYLKIPPTVLAWHPEYANQ